MLHRLHLPLLALLIAPALTSAASPTTVPTLATLPADLRPVQVKLDIPALIREVRATEAWIDKARTFRLTMQWTETRPPEMLEARKASYKKLMPEVEMVPDKVAGLLPAETYRTEIAFDETRVLYRRTSLDDGTFQTRIWDGKHLTEETKTPTSEPRTWPPATTPPLPLHVLYDLSNFRLSYHPLWLDRKDSSDQHPEGRPEDFELIGQTTYRGTACYLLDDPRASVRWFVGIKDHRLYGLVTSVITKEMQPQIEPILRQLAIELTGKPASWDTLEAFAKQLTPEQLADFSREFARRTAHLAIVLSEHWMCDYKEIAPGILFPMTQGIIFFPTRPAETYSRTSAIAEVELNQLLPDDLFQ